MNNKVLMLGFLNEQMKHYFLIILTLGLFWNAGMLSAQNHVVNDELTNVTYRALLIGNANPMSLT